jgi:heme/copper-type cytochrome/quinol oxidase subunit 2
MCFLYPGVYYGQCRELCGVNHSFIPVCVEAVATKTFLGWIFENHDENIKSMRSVSDWSVGWYA